MSLSPLKYTTNTSNIPLFSRENCDNGSQTTDYLLTLKAVELDSDPQNLAKQQWKNTQSLKAYKSLDISHA